MKEASQTFEQLNLWDTPSATFSPEYPDGRLPCNSQDGRRIGQFGRGLARARLSAPPASSSDLPTSATCGQCSEISSLSANLTSSLASRLKTQLSTVGSIEYTQTWKEKTTPAGLSYWAHTASERRTEDTGCIGALDIVDKGGSGDPTLRYLRNYEAKRVERREDLALRISIIW